MPNKKKGLAKNDSKSEDVADENQVYSELITARDFETFAARGKFSLKTECVST